MDQPKASIVTTADGSHSLYIAEFDEHYHSVHGAIQESKHVFIDAGLRPLASLPQLNILEIGFGTGLNALLTFLSAPDQKIHYTSLEAFPVEASVASSLNYCGLLGSNEQAFFENMHNCEWERDIIISENFSLHKMKAKLQEAEFEMQFDLVYFDAFAPRVQPELWTEEIFSKLFSVMTANSILVTYCAKGEVKRNLKKAGFIVETLPGPPGKREMVRGSI